MLYVQITYQYVTEKGVISFSRYELHTTICQNPAVSKSRVLYFTR